MRIICFRKFGFIFFGNTLLLLCSYDYKWLSFYHLKIIFASVSLSQIIITVIKHLDTTLHGHLTLVIVCTYEPVQQYLLSV